MESEAIIERKAAHETNRDFTSFSRCSTPGEKISCATWFWRRGRTYPHIPIVHQDHGNSPATCCSAKLSMVSRSVLMDGSLETDAKTWLARVQRWSYAQSRRRGGSPLVLALKVNSVGFSGNWYGWGWRRSRRGRRFIPRSDIDWSRSNKIDFVETKIRWMLAVAIGTNHGVSHKDLPASQ